jgi:NAD(P)-dependent dehydrogenase (short-subunit alcohol dehydrogenase family)
MVAVARDCFGGLDMLVNNAGEFGSKPFLQVSEQDLDHYYTVNLKGTYPMTQARWFPKAAFTPLRSHWLRSSLLKAFG